MKPNVKVWQPGCWITLTGFIIRPSDILTICTKEQVEAVKQTTSIINRMMQS